MTDLVVRAVPGDQIARYVTAYLHTLTPHDARTLP